MADSTERERMVAGRTMTSAPIRRRSAAVLSSFSGLRPQIATLAPSRADCTAIALPMPLPAPETSTTCPASRSCR